MSVVSLINWLYAIVRAPCLPKVDDIPWKIMPSCNFIECVNGMHLWILNVFSELNKYLKTNVFIV